MHFNELFSGSYRIYHIRKEYNLKPPGLNASRDVNSRPESLDNEKVRKKRIE